ncbi:MAG TPA: ornithine cyclodeaminase [Desulfobacteraceae bacterium]|nr:ornithine cyclodeaminase [Deltaproteobacteria bacterium]RLB98875.1 MAG: ornithine cyclodeaminase [Deltaproteobacteria bacterium]HDI60896.1 ornithine cyclodeaminase [Desulfobacteraceae bacterium]
MKIRILTASQVRAALPMPAAIDAMRSAFSQLSAGEAEVPLRGRVGTGKGVSLLMPAYMKKSGELGVKIISIYDGNPQRGLPTVSATVMVLDPETGLPLAFMDGSSLTAIRTGAAGGLAAEILSRSDARRMVLFGAGVQARTQLEAVLAVRQLEAVAVVDPSAGAARRLAADFDGRPGGPRVGVAEDPSAAVRRADIVVTATTARTPVFDGNDLRPGAHVTAVGSFMPDVQEIDADTVKRAYVVADSRSMALAEAGDLIIPRAVVEAEIGEIINGVRPGRRSDDQITLFKTVGVAVQDVVAAAAVLARAEAEGIGTVVELDA